MADDQTTGTAGAGQEGADAASAVSGTPDASPQGGDAANSDVDERIRKLEEVHSKYLAQLDTVERANQIIREREQEQASRASMPPTGYDPAVIHASQAIENLDDNTRTGLLAVTSVWQRELEKRDEAARREREQARFDRELEAVPSHRRAEVERLSKAERLWPSIIDQRLENQELKKEKDRVAEQARKLQEREDALKRGVVKTTAEPAPPKSDTGSPTREEYIRTQQAAGKGDRNALAKVREWDAFEEANGPMKLRDG